MQRDAGESFDAVYNIADVFEALAELNDQKQAEKASLAMKAVGESLPGYSLDDVEDSDCGIRALPEDEADLEW